MDYTRQAKEVLKIAEKSAKEMAHPLCRNRTSASGTQKGVYRRSGAGSGNERGR